jgi:hypothetical protein
MECMNQAQFFVNDTTLYTAASGEFKSWSPNSWVVKSTANEYIFNIQGFKNVNLYGIKILADVQSGINGSSQGIVTDYNFRCYLTAQYPEVSGTFTTNTYSAKTIPTFLSLSKYHDHVNFVEPIKSFSSIRFIVFSAQGINSALSTEISLDINMNLYLYYKYEGED